MIALTTARALAATGLEWDHRRGDRFVIVDREMDDQVFVLSDMTVETHDFPSGRVIGFNGTTEWALDSVGAEDVLWLPGEGALRGLIGPALVRLEPAGLAGWAVTSATGPDGAEATVVHEDAEEAYALALLALRARSARQLLPLAAHGVTARVADLASGPAKRWDEPSRAAGRTAAEVLEHLVEEHRWVRGLLAEGGHDGLEAVGSRVAAQQEVDPVAEDRVGTWRRAIASSLSAWLALPATADEPGGPPQVTLSTGSAPASEYAEQMLLDLVVHAWDLGVDALEPACAHHALAHARPLAPAWRAAGVFGPAVAVRDDADDAEQLIALTGRDAGVR